MVYFVRAQILGRIVLPSTLALSFHIALVCLRVSAALFQSAYSHTEKHMRGQRMRQKIASRTSSVFANRSRQGAAVERGGHVSGYLYMVGQENNSTKTRSFIYGRTRFVQLKSFVPGPGTRMIL